jgi:outer membrane biosynthesis protein TonB
MKRQTFFIFFLVLGFVTAGIAGYAQSQSYLDTIYQADQQKKGAATSIEEDDAQYAQDSANANSEIIDVPEQEGRPEQQTAQEKLQNVINNILRILTGKVCGTRIIIVVIPCEKIIPPPEPEPEPEPEPDPQPDPDPAPDPEPDPDPDPTPDPEPDPDPDPAPEPEPEPEPDPDPDPDPVVDPDQKPDDVEGMRAYIKDTYGIDCSDGDRATWSINQIKAADEAFESLPPFFRDATQVVYRDGPAPSFAPPTVLGYVIVPQRKVHMMDLSTKMTTGLYNSLVNAYGRAPTEEEQMAALKRNFQGTLVHEMTHTFQNTYPQIAQRWYNTFDHRTSPTGYGATQPAEDMAESVRVYWQGGRIQNGRFVSNGGTTMDLERYEFIKNYIMDGEEYLN